MKIGFRYEAIFHVPNHNLAKQQRDGADSFESDDIPISDDLMTYSVHDLALPRKILFICL